MEFGAKLAGQAAEKWAHLGRYHEYSTVKYIWTSNHDGTNGAKTDLNFPYRTDRLQRSDLPQVRLG